ncbi:hypothetical protein BaRGS_00037682 [Batillaria attramentaria]|uniref:Uncharacterized protein n=1 Tax=Batillaria attramentaria TaxID=370345 RepID=A0ABD0J7Y5_9CAEN
MAGYKFNYQVSTYLTVLVPNFSHNHTGRYVCQLVPPDPEGSDPCELSVADEVTDTEAPATVYEDKPQIINLKSQLTMDAQKSPSIEEKTSTEKRPVTPIVVGVALPVVVILSVIILAVLVKYTALGKRIWKRLKFPRVGPSKEQQISKTQNVEDESPTETASPLVTKPCQNGTREHTTEPDETSIMLDTDEKSAEEKSESDSGYQVEGGLHRSKSTECVSPSKQNNRNSSGDLKSRSMSLDALNESQEGGILQKAFSSVYYIAERATNAIFPIASLLGQNDSMQSSSKDPYEV